MIIKIIQKVFLIVTVFSLCFVIFNNNTYAEESKKYSEEELYEISGGDAEYWKYYDEEGNVLKNEGDKIPNGKMSSSNSVYSPYTKNNYILNDSYKISHGVDISRYNGTVDWKKMKASGIDYVIIRCACRAYGTTGQILNDPTFENNLKGAVAAGLKVGTYIYSQATTEKEAVEEANYCIKKCGTYITKLDLPVVMDVEFADSSDGGRLKRAKLSKAEQTKIIKAFGDRIKAAGATPMLYANASMLRDNINAKEIEEEGYPIWLAHYTNNSNYNASSYQFWQYSENGVVSGNGISRCDVNFMLEKEKPVYNSNNSNTTNNSSVSIELSKAVINEVRVDDYSSINISWNKVKDADAYIVYRKSDNGKVEDIYTTKSSSELSYLDKNVYGGVKYTYYVKAIANCNEKEYEGELSLGVSKTIELSLVNNIIAKKAAYNKINVKFSAVKGAQGYYIYRKVSGGKWVSIKKQSGTSYTDSSVVTGTNYYYTVRAYKVINGKTYKGPWKTYSSATACIDAPVLKSAVSQDYNAIKLTWGSVDKAYLYRVYRKNDVTKKWEKLAELKSSALSYVDKSKVTCGYTYTYTVRSVSKINGKIALGDFSASGIKGMAKPSRPSVKLSSKVKNTVNITWNKINGASGYYIYRKDSEKGSWKRIKEVSSKTLSCKDVVNRSGKTSYYTVRAYKVVNGKKVYSSYMTNKYIKIK